MQIKKLLQQGAVALHHHSVEDAENEARVLLCYCLGMSRTDLFLHGEEKVATDIAHQYFKLIDRRCDREPYAYIAGEKEFWSLPFYVDKNVLIPRPETELLLEIVLERVRQAEMNVDRCIDLCCGSGVIAVVLAIELRADVLALDNSNDALRTALRNIQRHKVEQCVHALQSDLFSAVEKRQRFPLIVSNPPYVRRSEIDDGLQPEVACYEPKRALDGGTDGLDIIRRIAGEVLCYLEPDGFFAMEHGTGQAADILDIFSQARWHGRCFRSLETVQDYSGHDRVLVARAE